MRYPVSRIAAAMCLVATSAAAQPAPSAPLAPLRPLKPSVRPSPPAPPADFFKWQGFDGGWAKDFAREMTESFKDVWAWNGRDAWVGPVGPFNQSRSQSSSRGASQTDSMEMAFSNPNTPGSVEVHLFTGSLIVRGTNRKDVAIRVTHRGGDTVFERDAPPPPPGMRRLNANRRGNLSVEEENNRIEVRSRSVNGDMDLELEVPARTNLELRLVNGGEIAVENVEGNIEVNNVNGPVRLTGISGSAVASSVNANVTVRLTRVSDAKAMAFSSLSGTVDVTLPSSTKANLKLRSDNGDVFTDFDVQQTDPPGGGWTRADRGNRRARFEVNNTIYGTINGGGPEIEARSFNGSVYIRKAQ
jgi:hypothetical protein